MGALAVKPICLPMIEPVHAPYLFERSASQLYTASWSGGLPGAHSHTRTGERGAMWDDYSAAGMAHVEAHAAAHARGRD